MSDRCDPASHRGEDYSHVTEAQARIAALRDQVLGGRGPGASSEELSAHMHERVTLGAIPTMVERELVARRTQLARGRNTVAMQLAIDQERSALGATVAEIIDRLAPDRAAMRAIRVGRRRAEALLGMSKNLQDEGGGLPADTRAKDDDHFTDPRWWRVFAAGAASGAILVVGVLAIVSRRDR